MAPKLRKNVDKTPSLEKKVQATKIVKLKVKKEKPKLRIPTVVKLKIPTSSLTLNNVVKNMPTKSVDCKNETSPRDTRNRKKKQLTAADKLELANEVAREQLVKSNPALQCEAPPPCVTVPTINNTESVKKRGRKKKVLSESTDNLTASSVTSSEEAFDLTPKKRKYVRKTPIVPTTVQAKKKPVLVRKNRAVEEKKSSPLSLKKKLKQTKITDITTGVVKNNECAKTPVQNDTAKGAPIARRRKLIARKGKPDADNASSSDVQISPSLLNQLESVRKDIFLPFESPTKGNIEACTIDSRKTSTTATSECLSWTKDISNSSTTTCVTVCSNDFVRIDKKIPVLKLTQTPHISQVTKPPVVETNELSSDSDSSSSDLTPRTPRRKSTPDIDAQSLDLSTSSVTPKKPQDSPANSEVNDQVNDIATAIKKMTAKLKNFDVEINNWIGYDNDDVDVKVKKFQDRIFRLLKEESEVVAHCRGLKKDLLDNGEEENGHANENVEDFVVPVNAIRYNLFNDGSSVTNVNNYNNKDTNSPPNTNERLKDREDQATAEFKFNIPFDHSYDDDDALSLFAESITGIEPSRRNSTVVSLSETSATRFEEYVPQPVRTERWEPAGKISYVPSKITNVDVQNSEIKKSVCEKQSADSTSISKDKQLLVVNFDKVCNTPAAKVDANDPSQLSLCVPVEKKKVACLMAALFKSLPGIKSMLFKGICFFNLINSCKMLRCRFPHVIPERHEVSKRIERLSEESFIGEYMLLRGWPMLRRRYAMCFVEECIRRDLTRILVEMAIDFYMKANDNSREDATLRVVVIESVLLHLNTVTLQTCDDLLLFSVQQGLLLCDVFMETIANTQNFSRFKQVFVNLTNFVVYHQKRFTLEVATHILERVCILPCEQALTKALFQVVKYTDQAIFENSMIGLFEKQLSSVDSELYDQCLLLKKQADINRPVVRSLFEMSPHLNSEELVINTSLVHTERQKRYTSPDTTNLDNMNKPVDEPIITRTIDFNRARHYSDLQRSFSNSNSSMSNDSNEEFRVQPPAKPMNSYQSWKGQSVFDKIRGQSPVPRQGAYLRPKLIQRRIHQQLNFGPGSTFPRRPGPDFF